MLRTINWYAHFACSLIAKIPTMYKVKSYAKNHSEKEVDEYVNKITSKWAMKHVKRSGADVKVYGLENIPKDKPVLFVSNHQGNFDIALFMSYIDKPKGYVAKSEIKKVPLLSTWMEYIHCVFMDRKNMKQSARAIVEGIQTLRSGHSMVIFPEGTRSKGDKMADLKAGSFKLATKAKVPIIPVTINGSYKLMEANNNMIKPAEVEMYIHPMIETINLSKEDEKDLHNKVQTIIESKLPKVN